jgi:hypothetical protein
VSKRPTLLGTLAAQPKPQPELAAEPQPARPREMVALYARIPPQLSDKLKDIARERSKAAGKRVTVNDIVLEQLQKLAL